MLNDTPSDKVERMMAIAMRDAVFEQLTPPCYTVGNLGPHRFPNYWNWNAKLDKKKVVVGVGYPSRKEACLAAWRHFEDQLRAKLEVSSVKKKRKKWPRENWVTVKGHRRHWDPRYPWLKCPPHWLTKWEQDDSKRRWKKAGSPRTLKALRATKNREVVGSSEKQKPTKKAKKR